MNDVMTVPHNGQLAATKTGSWIPLTEENILEYDMPARSGMDRQALLRYMDVAHRESRILHMWIEEDHGASAPSEEGAQ